MWSRKHTCILIELSLLVGLQLTVLLLPSAGQRGDLVLQRNLAELVDEAATVVRGRVMGIESEPHPQFPNLHTIVVTLDVLEVLKGETDKHFTFRQFIHDIRDRETRLGYKRGQEVLLLMIRPSRYGLSSPAGLEQGRFRIRVDSQGNRYAVNGLNNLGLLRNIEAKAPKLGQQLNAEAQRLLTQHRGGPIAYDQLVHVIHSIIANRNMK